MTHRLQIKKLLYYYYNTLIGDLVRVSQLAPVWTIVADFLKHRILLLLDYFWLQQNYYKERYGMLWLTHHARAFLQAGVTQVMLPVDKRHDVHSKSNMEVMLSGKISEDLCVEFIPLSSNPLWLASEGKWLNEVGHKWTTREWSNSEHSGRLDEERPFIRITINV